MVRAISLVGCKNFIVDKPEQIKDPVIVLPAGILVFVNEATLNHKKKDGFKKNDECYFWETKKPPKRFIDDLCLSKSLRISYDQKPYDLLTPFAIYFAIKGKIRGYFIVNEIHSETYWSNKEVELWFHSDTWQEIKDGEVLKPSQGWRYYPK